VRRRLTLIVLGISVVGMTAALACGFPDVDFAADEQLVDGSVAPNDSGSSGTDGSVPTDAGNPDGNTCKGDPVCDCDGDGDPSPACDGGDCDDHDDRVRSTQTSFIDATSSRAGDWNCDNKVELEADSGVVCTKLIDAGWALTATPDQIAEACAKEGFVGNPGCGESGIYNRCRKVDNVDSKVCQVIEQSSRARGCR